uniref:Tudor domain-containing protein n=1 Tax=Clastoptera arizonana TaxID=38151 RepID=A0A1B6DQ92_9HEMI
MPPVQSRQLLIWSLPTLVLLFGFFWYKRKKRTDPGGKDNITGRHLDSNKSLKEIENIRNSITSYEDDEEYTVHDLTYSVLRDRTSLSTAKEVSGSILSNSIFDKTLCTSTPVANEVPVIDDLPPIEYSYNYKEIDKNNKETVNFFDLVKSEPSNKLDLGTTIEISAIETSFSNDSISPMAKKKKHFTNKNSIATGVDGITLPPNSSNVLESDKENHSLNSKNKDDYNNVKVLSERDDAPTESSFKKELDDILETKMTDKELVVEKNESTNIENKLSNLGLDTAQNIEKTERDSANHSPAEVMLGSSPLICHFSDEHSEGSSDSGKGCSDVVTPPSRTPAGGSSVAGDQVQSVYEFVLEQHIVGRLIGRHGAYLQDIRGKTNTNIFIKRHPDTSKLKICAIEGNQQDIDAALAMIRQKFPLRRFPNLTLEKVTFVQPSTHYPLKPEIFQLQLVEGVNNDVLLSSLITAGHFFLQQPTHPSYPSLLTQNVMMNALYNSPEAPPLSEPIIDAICVAPTMGGWYRAQIMSIDEENATSYVRFLDYGGYLTVSNSVLRQIRGDFLLLPFQAIECLLANVVPIGGEGAEWSEEARQVVHYLTQQQVLQAQVYDYTDTGIPLVYLYSTQTTQNGLELVLINEDLVARNYAEMVVPPTEVQ